jgi:hypothetical protein
MAKRASLFSVHPGAASEASSPTITHPPVKVKDEKQSQDRPPSRKGKRTFSVYLKPEALKQLRLLSVQAGQSGQELGEEAINLLFEKHRLNRIA